MFHRQLPAVVLAVVALVVFEPRAADASSFTTTFFQVNMSYLGDEGPPWVGEILRQETERISREERLEHVDVLSTGGFVANANGTLLQAATEVAANAYIDFEAGVFWDRLLVSGVAIASTSDVLTIEGPTGMGVIRFHYSAEGTLYHQLAPGPGSGTGGGYVVDEMIAGGYLRFEVQDQGVEIPFSESLEPALDPINPQLARQTENVSGGPASTRDFPFPFNTPFRVDYSLAATVELIARNVDAGELLWLGGAGFDNTAEILGVAVFDGTGAPIANPVIHSEAGLLYPAVPEPSTALLVALGAIGLAARSRRAVQRSAA